MDKLIEIARRWINTPYMHNTSEIHVGVDCVQFIAAVYQERFPRRKLILPPYLAPENLEPHLGFENIKLPKSWMKITDANPIMGDIAVISLGNRRYHTGLIAMKNNRMSLIHVRINLGVVEEEFSNFWRFKVINYYRFF